MVVILILVAAFCILGWGFYRSRAYGQLGVLSWLQSLVVSLPWLLFFGLSTLGIFLNLASILLLLLISTVTYIWLGARIRALAKIQQEGDRSPEVQAPDAQAPDAQTGSNAPAKASTRYSERPLVQSSEKTTSPNALPSSLPESSSAPESSNSDPAADPSPPQAPRSEPDTPLPLRPKGDSVLPRIPDEDQQKIRSIFSVDTFFSTDQEPYYNGLIFKGNLRGDAATVHERLSQRLSDCCGDTYRLYLMDDPSVKPVVVVFPKSNDPTPSTQFQWVMAGFLFVATGLTCMVASSVFQGFSLFEDWSRWPDTLPLAMGLLMVLVGHELGHWVVARRYGIRLGPPFFLPTWQIGSFGALTRLESVLPHRTALFDIGFAGPAIGGCLSLILLLVGLFLSHEGSLFQLSPTFFHSSILVGTLARVTLGDALQQSLVDVDPLVIVGWLGLLITAINVMPVGQLDGGRIVQSIYGRKVLRRASIVTLVVLAIATFFNPLALYWMVVILVLQRQLEQPNLNELTEPDDTRAALGLLALFLMVAMLLPLSPELANRLGIGG